MSVTATLGFDPRAVFPHFYDNPVIGLLANQPIWTVSDPVSKMPVDARHLLDGCTQACSHPDVVRGAWAHDERVLVTLTELTDTLPTAANCAMWLDTPTQGCLVLDIEKTCPPDVRDNLLRIGALYAEHSLSGKGYHLVLPLPRSFHALPLAAQKTVLREPHGWWEVLQNTHFVTFTRYPTSLPVSSTIDDDLWDETWLSLAQTAQADLIAVREFDIEDRPEQPWYDPVLSILIMRAGSFSRTLESYNFDHSRYEWAYANSICTQLLKLRTEDRWIRTDSSESIPMGSIIIDDSTTAWLIYDTLVHHLDHRPKHDETRNGLPFLLYRAKQVVAARE